MTRVITGFTVTIDTSNFRWFKNPIRPERLLELVDQAMANVTYNGRKVSYSSLLIARKSGLTTIPAVLVKIDGPALTQPVKSTALKVELMRYLNDPKEAFAMDLYDSEPTFMFSLLELLADRKAKWSVIKGPVYGPLANLYKENAKRLCFEQGVNDPFMEFIVFVQLHRYENYESLTLADDET